MYVLQAILFTHCAAERLELPTSTVNHCVLSILFATLSQQVQTDSTYTILEANIQESGENTEERQVRFENFG